MVSNAKSRLFYILLSYGFKLTANVPIQGLRIHICVDWFFIPYQIVNVIKSIDIKSKNDSVNVSKIMILTKINVIMESKLCNRVTHSYISVITLEVYVVFNTIFVLLSIIISANSNSVFIKIFLDHGNNTLNCIIKTLR